MPSQGILVIFHKANNLLKIIIGIEVTQMSLKLQLWILGLLINFDLGHEMHFLVKAPEAKGMSVVGC